MTKRPKPRRAKYTNPQYFEGILQVRNPDDAVRQAIELLLGKHPDIHIAKENVLRSGYDLYLNDKRFVRLIANHLHQRFGAALKESAKLHTRDRQSGKELYRLTICAAIPTLKPETIIEAGGGAGTTALRVTSVGKRISGIDLSTGKRVFMPPDADYAVLKKQKSIITKLKPRLEVMDPESYDSVAVANEGAMGKTGAMSASYTHGQHVMVAKTRKGIMLI